MIESTERIIKIKSRLSSLSLLLELTIVINIVLIYARFWSSSSVFPAVAAALMSENSDKKLRNANFTMNRCGADPPVSLGFLRMHFSFCISHTQTQTFSQSGRLQVVWQTKVRCFIWHIQDDAQCTRSSKSLLIMCAFWIAEMMALRGQSFHSLCAALEVLTRHKTMPRSWRPKLHRRAAATKSAWIYEAIFTIQTSKSQFLRLLQNSSSLSQSNYVQTIHAVLNSKNG